MNKAESCHQVSYNLTRDVHCAQSLCHVWLCSPVDCGPPGSSSMRCPSREYWSGFLFLPPLTEDTCKKRNYKMVPRRQNRVFEIGDVGERLTNLGRGGEVGKGSNEEVTWILYLMGVPSNTWWVSFSHTVAIRWSTRQWLFTNGMSLCFLKRLPFQTLSGCDMYDLIKSSQSFESSYSLLYRWRTWGSERGSCPASYSCSEGDVGF